MAGDRRPRVPCDEAGADREQDAQFGRADAGERQAEYADRMRREEGFGGDEEVGGDERERDRRRHQPRRGHAGHERGRARQVDDVIDVVAVARTRLQRTRASVPSRLSPNQLTRERDGNDAAAQGVTGIGGEGEAGSGHREQTEQGQVIGAQPRRQPPCDSDEQRFFGGSEHAPVLAHMVHISLQLELRKGPADRLGRA